MKETFITDLLIIAAIMVFLHGLSSSVQYHAFSGWRNYSDAHAACQENKSKHLAKISNPDELSQARNSSGYSHFKKYWTALQVLYIENDGEVKWRWSDAGTPFPTKSWIPNIVLDVDDAKTLVEEGPIKVYCFLITSENLLLIENCSIKHAYICEGSEGSRTPRIDCKLVSQAKTATYISNIVAKRRRVTVESLEMMLADDDRSDVIKRG